MCLQLEISREGRPEACNGRTQASEDRNEASVTLPEVDGKGTAVGQDAGHSSCTLECWGARGEPGQASPGSLVAVPAGSIH